MKKLVACVEGEGLEGLLGQRVTFFSMNYIYTGDLTGVDETTVLLENAAIVYDTGAFTDKAWADAQPLPNPVYLRLAAVEAYTVLK